MNMQESKHCFSTLNPPNTFRFKGVLQNGAENGLNPAKSLISSCKVILSGWQLWFRSTISSLAMECIHFNRCVDSKKATSHSIVSLLQRLANVMATCCMCRSAQQEEKEVAWTNDSKKWTTTTL